MNEAATLDYMPIVQATDTVKEDGKKNSLDIKNNESLWLAAKDGDMDTVQRLLAMDPPPDVDFVKHYTTPLEIALDSKHLEIVKLLYINEASAPQDALDRALKNRDIPMAEFFMDIFSHAMIDGRIALESIDCPLVPNDIPKILLEPVESVDDPRREGYTTLHLASIMNLGGYVEWLLDNFDASKTLSGKTAWDCALANSAYDAIGALARKEIHTLNPDGSAKLTFYWAGHELTVLQLNESILPSNYLPGDSWYHFCDGNSKILLYGLLRVISKSSRLYQRQCYESIQMVEQNFGEDNTACHFLSAREASCVFDNLETSKQGAADQGSDYYSFVSVVMPYFYSSTLTTLQSRENYEGLTRYHYCQGQDRNLLRRHLPQTLDEYCNSSLDINVLNDRNVDQVVHRYLTDKPKASINTPYHLPSIVTVPQAWIWKVNNNLFTASPPSTADDSFLVDKMDQNWHLVFDSSTYRLNLPGRIELFLGMLLSDLVDCLERPVNTGLSASIFSIFEKAISKLSDDVNEYTEITSVETINIKMERKFLHDIDDVREELSMISTVLFQQEEVWKEFVNRTWPQYWPDGPNGRFKPPERLEVTVDETSKHPVPPEVWRKIQKPQNQFAKFKRQISKLDADAERVARAIDRKLDLKATHASLKESHTTAIMSAAIFGFTIITIIFTPLSFAVTLFALPIDRFQKDQVPSVWGGQTGMYSTNYVGKWIATVELVSVTLTLALMWIMIEYGLDVRITEKTLKWVRVFLRLEPPDERTTKTKKRKWGRNRAAPDSDEEKRLGRAK